MQTAPALVSKENDGPASSSEAAAPPASVADDASGAAGDTAPTQQGMPTLGLMPAAGEEQAKAPRMPSVRRAADNLPPSARPPPSARAARESAPLMSPREPTKIAQVNKGKSSVSFYDKAANVVARQAQQQRPDTQDPTLANLLELDKDVVTHAVKSPKSWAIWTGVAIFCADVLVTLGVSLYFIISCMIDSADTYNSLAGQLRWRLLAGLSMGFEALSLFLWFLELWIHLHRKKSRVADAKMIGASSVWECMSGAPSVLVMVTAVVMREALSVGSVWQPILLPVAVFIFCPVSLIVCATSYSMGPVNAAASSIAYNTEGFLTPVCAVDVAPDLMKTRATPLNHTVFVRFEDIREVQMAYSVTKLSFLARKSESGSHKFLLGRATASHRLFFLLCSLRPSAVTTSAASSPPSSPPKQQQQAQDTASATTTAAGKGEGEVQLEIRDMKEKQKEMKPPAYAPGQQAQSMIGFLIAPQSRSIMVRPQRFYGVSQDPFRHLLGMISRKVPTSQDSVQSIVEVLDRHSDEFVIQRVYGSCC